jgi:hypothetical protein
MNNQIISKQETLDEFLARGGKVDKLAPRKIPTQKINPKPSGRVMSLSACQELFGKEEQPKIDIENDKKIIALKHLIQLFTDNGNYPKLVYVKQAYNKRIKELKGE